MKILTAALVLVMSLIAAPAFSQEMEFGFGQHGFRMEEGRHWREHEHRGWDRDRGWHRRWQRHEWHRDRPHYHDWD